MYTTVFFTVARLKVSLARIAIALTLLLRDSTRFAGKQISVKTENMGRK